MANVDESSETSEPGGDAPRAGAGPGLRARLLGGLLAVLVLLGSAWTIQGWGTLPAYGDSQNYYSLALRGRTDPYRGWMYPHVVGWIAAPGKVSRSAEGYLEFKQGLSGGLRKLQLAQLGALAATIALFLRALGARARPRWLAAALFLALLFDPLVAHFSLAMMPDGFALAASLLWCAGAADLLAARAPAWRALLAVVSGHVLAAGLRPEKNLVVLAAAGTCWLLVELLARRRGSDPGGPAPARARWLLAAALPVFALGAVLQPDPEAGDERWPLATTILHQRVVFPYLGDVLAELPERERGGLDEPAAAFHDASLFQARQIVERLEELQPEVPVEERIEVWAAEVWSRHAAAIALDTALDGLEAVLATPAFYGHLSASALLGPAGVTLRHDPATDNTHRMHERFAEERAGLSNAYLALGGVLFLLAALLAVGRSGPGGGAVARCLPWLPTLAFVVVNAGAFALTQNLTQVRYALLAHVALLAWVYGRALRPARG